MKKLSFLPTKTSRVLLLSCFSLVLLLSACLKSKDNEPLPVGDVKIQYVNAFQGSETQDFYVTNTKLGASVAYGQSSEYTTVTSDNTLFTFKKANATDVSVAIQGRLQIGGNYTFFYVKDNTGVTGILPVANEQAVPPTGKARVRFINLNTFIPDSTPLAIKVQGAADNLVTNLKFGYTGYYTVDAGAKFDVVAPAITLSIVDANLEAGKTYTIWIGGSSPSVLDSHVIKD